MQSGPGPSGPVFAAFASCRADRHVCSPAVVGASLRGKAMCAFGLASSRRCRSQWRRRHVSLRNARSVRALVIDLLLSALSVVAAEFDVVSCGRALEHSLAEVAAGIAHPIQRGLALGREIIEHLVEENGAMAEFLHLGVRSLVLVSWISRRRFHWPGGHGSVRFRYRRGFRSGSCWRALSSSKSRWRRLFSPAARLAGWSRSPQASSEVAPPRGRSARLWMTRPSVKWRAAFHPRWADLLAMPMTPRWPRGPLVEVASSALATAAATPRLHARKIGSLMFSEETILQCKWRSRQTREATHAKFAVPLFTLHSHRGPRRMFTVWGACRRQPREWMDYRQLFGCACTDQANCTHSQ